MPADRALIRALRAALLAGADPARAADQQRYMKSALPFYGLSKPQLGVAVRAVLADPAYRITDRATWEATIRALWDEVTHREEWYAALLLAQHRHYRAWRDGDAMPLWRHLVVTGAWWDVVDETATHLVREALVRDPAREGIRLREWAIDDDLWLRRAAIICQVGLRDGLDEDLLTDAIEPNLADRDFFVRKGIGWALRDHARVAPAWVREFVDAHADTLSPLSRREATKHLVGVDA